MKKINAKRIFFVTDTHFGVRNNSEDWINIQRDFFFNWFIPLAKKNYKPGDVLFHLGDVFDSRQSINLKVLNFAIEIFEELSKIFVDGIYIICGNHDIFGKTSNNINSLASLKWIPNITIFEEPETILASGKTIFLMPWRKDHQAEHDTLLNAKEHDYMFCHTDIKGLMFNRFVRIDAGLNYEDINKFGKVYSGHIHYTQIFGKMNMLGPPYQLTRSDTDNPKGITLLDIENGFEEYFENTFSPKFIRMSFEKVLNSTPAELNPIFSNNFIDILVDPEIAVKAPLGLLTEYVTPPLKISFTPTTSTDSVAVDDTFHDLEGKNFSILELTKLYLEKADYEEDKSQKIYKAVEKLLKKVSTQKEEMEEENENQEN
jgi:DNA repair exonuclease SbcCD nuclease subunit